MPDIQVNIANELDFYAWVDRCLFPSDFLDYVIESGIIPEVEARFTFDDYWKRLHSEGQFNIVKLWQLYCVGKWVNEDLKQCLLKYLEDMRQRFV